MALLSSCNQMSRLALTPSKPLALEIPPHSAPALPSITKTRPWQSHLFIQQYQKVVEVTAPIAEGKASWYGPNLHGNMTASGERYNMHDLTAAHPTLPFNTLVWVENEDNGRTVLVRINDRGPYAAGRIIDLSKSAARKLRMLGEGVAEVQIYRVKRKPRMGTDHMHTEHPYTIQLGIFSDGEAAFRHAKHLNGSRVEVIKRGTQTYYGVFYGWYPNSRAAFKKKRELQNRNFTGFVTKINIS